VVAGHVEVEAAERQVGKGTPRQRHRAPIGVLGVGVVAQELVDAPQPLPDVARRRIDLAGLFEEPPRAGVVAPAEEQLGPAGEQVLRADRRRVGLGVERPTGVERRRGRVELGQIPEHARQVEEDLDLDAAAAQALLGAGLVPDVASTGQRLDGLARPMELLEAVAAPEQAEVVGREGLQRAVVPAERLGPFLLPLEIPADGAVEDGGAARRQVGAPEQVPLDLVFVAQDPERAADLVEQIR
jgi:hypothetical protein